MPVSARVRRVERAVLFIESRLFDELDVAHIAQAAGGSVSELHRLFRRVHGMPLMAYVRARRLTEATRMLDTADVLEVARRCGYESQATFTRAFTRRFGVPPGRFRRQGAGPYRRVEGATQASLAHRDALQAPDLRWLHADVPLWGIERLVPDPEDPTPFVQAAVDLQAMTGPDAIATGCVLSLAPMRYFLGVETALATSSATASLPAGLYAVYVHRGPAERVPETLSWVGSQLDADLVSVVERPHAERYRLGDIGDDDLRIELWLGVTPIA
ncbi:MAG: AraC family transcriptional regulator [Alphaproteobacteria bacterium]|nr:AraC family transcriptional regulator [Alphaproteobacteria bacterium]MCB9699905.1 AraC family transcriptional regulator [Alphaproteobacteria bacterium]